MDAVKPSPFEAAGVAGRAAGRRWPFAWRMSFRTVMLLMAALSGILIFSLILIDLADLALAEGALNGAEVFLPILAGIGAGLLFAPDDEPILELMLSSPRPVRYVFYERALVLIALQGGVGLAASLVVAAQGADFAVHVLRWLPPTVAAMGASVFASLWGRRSSYGVLMAVVLCAGMALAQEVLLASYPDLWPVVLYVQPADVTPEQYLINRVLLVLIGAAGFILVVARLGQTEALLGAGDTTR